MSVSSTSISASMTDMSAISRSTVPALFIVPIITVSPSSMLRRVTSPSIGDTIRSLVRSYRALSTFASSALIRCSCVRTDCSACARFVSIVLTLLAARS